MEAKCSICGERSFEFVLFKEPEGDIYHYHYFWQFETLNKYTRRNSTAESLFAAKESDEILAIILEKYTNIEILGLFCPKCAKRGLNKCEMFRKFKGDKPYCYFCNKTLYQIDNIKHPLVVGFAAIQKQENDNIVEMRAFHRDRVTGLQ